MTFNPSYSGIGELLNADFIEAALRERADKVRVVAEATAPFDAKSLTHYKDAFHIESGTHGGNRHDRAYARVVNDDDAALYVEYGTRNNPRHRTLGKALDAAKD